MKHMQKDRQRRDRKKALISIFLAAVLLIGMAQIAAFAEEAPGAEIAAADDGAAAADGVAVTEESKEETESAEPAEPEKTGQAEEAEQPAGEPGETPEEITLEQTTEDGAKITVQGTLPEGTVMRVKKVDATAELSAALDEMASEEGQTVAAYAAYDITLADAKGNEVQPAEGQSVRVTIHNPAVAKEIGRLGVAYVSDDRTAAESVAEGCETAEATHFSIYAVVKLKSVGVTVRFEVDEEAFGLLLNGPLDEKTVNYGKYCSPPEEPRIEGFTFSEWRLDGKKFDFSKTVIDKDITLFAYFTKIGTAATEEELRTAIAGVPADGALTVIEVVSKENKIELTGDPLEIPENTDIRLNGGGALVGANGQDVITVRGKLTIDGLTVTHADGQTGRGISVQKNGSLILENGFVKGNQAELGGGVYIGEGASFWMKNGEISGNKAGNGGGVYVAGKGSFSMFSGRIGGMDGGTGNTAVNGGGVYCAAGGTASLEGGYSSFDSAVSYNKATQNGGGVYAGPGAGNPGSGLSVNRGNVIILKNTAGGNGGGIYSEQQALQVGAGQMSGVIISGNQANGSGGGVYVKGYINLEGSKTVVDGNEAGLDGGGLYVTGSLAMRYGSGVTGNRAGKDGGGVYMAGTITADGQMPQSPPYTVYPGVGEGMIPVRFSGNEAAGNGGGLYADAGSVALSGTACSIYNNIAGKSGGGVYVKSASSVVVANYCHFETNHANGGDGGGMYVGKSSVVSAAGASFVSNDASRNGGGMYIAGADTVQIHGTVNVRKNIANGGDGGGMYLDPGAGVPVTLNLGRNYGMQSGMSDNKADSGRGGGAYLASGKAAMTYTDVLNNTARYGAGVYLDGSAVLNVEGSNFKGNNAAVGGGAIGLWRGKLPSLTVGVSQDGAEDYTDSGVFANNTAPTKADKFLFGDETIYTANIKGTVWSVGSNGYNNYDIQYLGDFTVTFDSHGGSSVPPIMGVVSGSKISAPTAPTKTGYAFAEWYKEAGYGNRWDFGADSVTGDITLHAKWTANRYNINYYANGGEGSMARQEAVFDKSVTLTTNRFTRTGYTFTGWNTEAGGNGTAYTDGGTFKWAFTKDLSLYAQWARNIYTVQFIDWNGAVISSQRIPHGDSLARPANPVRTGYTFAGWSPAVVTVVTADATYTAQYSSAAYTVTYQPGEHGTFAARTVSGLAAGAATPAAPTATGESGWNFTGWSPAVSPTVTGSATYTAQWAAASADTYSVTYLPGEHGTFAERTVSGLAMGTATPAAPDVTGEAGWNFTGWSPAVSATVTGSATYTAQWAPATPGGDTPTEITVDDVPTNEEVSEMLEEEGVPSINLFGQKVPLGAGKLTNMVWALLNLILAVAGMVLGIVTVIRAVKKNRGQDGGDETYGYDGGEDAEKSRRRRLGWLIAAVLMAVAGIVLFCCTENIRLLMTLTDGWTIVNLVIFIIEVIGSVFVLRRPKRDDGTRQDEKLPQEI